MQYIREKTLESFYKRLGIVAGFELVNKQTLKTDIKKTLDYWLNYYSINYLDIQKEDNSEYYVITF